MSRVAQGKQEAPARKRSVRRIVLSALLVVGGTWLLAEAFSLRSGIISAAVLIAVDRLLLFFESRGWINYRRRGPHWGAATYYTLELSAAFDPAFQEVVEVKYFREEDRDDSGGPPTPDDEADPTGAH